MGHDNDIARVERASSHLDAARVHLENALAEVYDSAFGDVPQWVLDDLNETFRKYGLLVSPTGEKV